MREVGRLQYAHRQPEYIFQVIRPQPKLNHHPKPEIELHSTAQHTNR